MNKFLIIDSNYLCHRAANTTGHLTHEGKPTGIAFGMFKTIAQLRDKFETDNLIFCWDYGRNKRIKIDPAYKSKRRKECPTDDELLLKNILEQQMTQLRTEFIPQLGFNSLWAAGFEADDIIANICQRTPKGSQSIIVSSDGDLFQLLDADRVVYYRINKGVIYTEADLLAEYCVFPMQWQDVKAIAGCTSDNVKGVAGVAEKTAAKYLNGSLRPQSKAFIAITKAADLWEHNLSLVSLPLPGTPSLKIKKTKYNNDQWHTLCGKLGFTSLGGGRRRGERF